MKRQKNKYADYQKATAEFLLSLLEDAYYDEVTIDQMIEEVSDEVVKEFQELLKYLEYNGKIDFSKPFNLRNYPSIWEKVREAEYKAWNNRMDRLFSWLNVVYVQSLTRTYQNTVITTYNLFQNTNYSFKAFTSNLGLTIPQIQITDTYIYQRVLPIPWCQDGKVYSERLYSHVANFQSKLNFVLEEGITKGKGMDWMMEAWRKLTHSTLYDASRLLKTETVAMWSQATKETYLAMGIEYVEIVGDAACGEVCTDYVGEVVPLREAELGNELPPYHPNCACSYIAYESLDEE